MKAFIVILLVAIAGYFGYRYFFKAKPSEPPSVEVQTEVESEPEPPPPVATRVRPATTNRAMTAVVKDRPPVAPPTGEWKPKLEAIMASSASPETKIQEIRELLAELPEADAEQAVQGLTLSVTDAGFGFIKPLVVDPTLPEPVRDEFMVDLMNRPNSIKIPLFLELARNPDHPDHENAYETLEAFTGLNFGADWGGWEKGIESWLKENPDRPRRANAPAEVN